MSLIFDSFPSKSKAEAFVTAVRALGIRADVWDSQEEMIVENYNSGGEFGNNGSRIAFIPNGIAKKLSKWLPLVSDADLKAKGLARLADASFTAVQLGKSNGKVSDFFPSTLTAPIVCVERLMEDGNAKTEAAESEAEEMVSKFGGVFAGT